MGRRKSPIRGIYCIANIVNGKCYIGSSEDIMRRWSSHRCELRSGRSHHCQKLQRAWNKHGESAFSFLILEVVPTRADLFAIEQAYITEKRPEYNVAQHAGGSPSGWKQTVYAKQDISGSKKRRTISAETRARISAALTGRALPVDHGLRRPGRTMSEAGRISLSRARRANDDTVERARKLARSNIGRKMSPDAIEKIRASHLGSKRTDATRWRIAQARRLSYFGNRIARAIIAMDEA